MFEIPAFVWPILGYLFGSISSAILISKIFRLGDPRETGSGNPGATNVLRSGNKFAAALTLLGDVLKGVIPVVLAQYAGVSVGVLAAVSIAAFMGHLFPIFFGFKGGKGVATAIGVFIALSWKLVLVFSITWGLVAAISRYSSLASLMATSAAGIASFAIHPQGPMVPASSGLNKGVRHGKTLNHHDPSPWSKGQRSG